MSQSLSEYIGLKFPGEIDIVLNEDKTQVISATATIDLTDWVKNNRTWVEAKLAEAEGSNG